MRPSDSHLLAGLRGYNHTAGDLYRDLLRATYALNEDHPDEVDEAALATIVPQLARLAVSDPEQLMRVALALLFTVAVADRSMRDMVEMTGDQS